MRDLTRAEAIENLEDLSRRYENAIHDYYGIARIEVHKDECEAVKIGIDSLKTDETYQIEYERRDFIEIPEGATNGDVIRSVFPKAYIEEDREDTECVFTNINHGITFDVDWWDEPYRKEQE